MIFILLLIASAMAIAGSAAYFSVYGLAFTFSGVFWSVVVMGGSLEAGKLIAASYLYRYWKKTNVLLKAYLMAGILALMVMTSTGIFGYLSTGYQTDVLPLKQLNEQVKLLESEKVRNIERKTQIDQQISQLPTDYVKGRERLIKQFRGEQTDTSKRIAAIEKELLTLKISQIKTEAHIGPITYIAKAFGVETDVATKWLIFLIIFAFDPMAVALTLAVNIALRYREEEKLLPKPDVITPVVIPPVVPIIEAVPVPEPVVAEPIIEAPVMEEPIIEEPHTELQLVEEPVAEPVEDPTPPPKMSASLTRTVNNPGGAYSHPWETNVNDASINELITIYHGLRDKETKEGLSPDEKIEKEAIENICRKNGMLMYLQ